MKTRIVYILNDISDCGGIQQTTCLLINRLIKTDLYYIDVVSVKCKNITPFFNLAPETKVHTLFEGDVDTKKDYLKIKKQLGVTMKSINPDCIVIQGTAYSCFISNDLWKTKRVIVCEHGHYYMGGRFGLHWFGRWKALKHASAIVTLTELDADNYRAHSRKQIPILKISNPTYKYDCEANNQDSHIIVSCGTLDNIKRFDHAIKAAQIVLSVHPDWQWYIYGDGNQREALQKLIDSNNLQTSVFLKGYEKDKSIIYGDKAFLVLTSKFEGFGMVLIEAMQFGLPIISYDVCYGPKEIIENGINGYLVDDGNITQLAETVEKMILDENKRAQMADKAFKSLDKYSIDSVTDQWVKLFDSLI